MTYIVLTACWHAVLIRVRCAKVSHLTDSNLSARLPPSWLPSGDVTALLEASMQQRGYAVQLLPLQSMVSMSGAQFIFWNLPTPNTTAFQLVLNVRCRIHSRVKQARGCR